MDFLFTPLPPNNFQMSDDELRLWQRNAIFECECDNFINRRVEYSCLGRPVLMHSAIEAAISAYGMRMHDENIAQSPPTQRRRLNEVFAEREPDGDSILEGFYEEAIATAIRDRGLRKSP